MSKHQPWSKEDAENEAFNRIVYGKRLSPHQQEIWLDALIWAAAQIEKCPTIYAARSESRTWGMDKNPYDDTIKAKLVGVKEIEP